MIKKILAILTITISLISVSFGDYKTIVTNVLDNIQSTNNGKSDLQKRSTFQGYIPKIQKLTIIDQRVRDALITYLNAKIAQINESSTTTTYSSNITNIDKSLIEKTWLERHNTERKTLGLDNVSIRPELNNTAQNRANHLSNLNYSTHKRLSTDGYYSYDSIKSRFSDLGVNFPAEKNGVANFSENIAYQYLNCKKSDCTTEVITALKKCFGFFMSEKSYNGAHYRAIASPYFKKIGYGISKVGTRIFIVTHYSVDF